MKKKITQLLIAFVVLIQTLAPSAYALETNPIIRVGLFYGNDALPTANLENSVDSGYYFGYFTDTHEFMTLGYTSEKQISMLKTQTIYLQNSVYYDTRPSGTCSTIGCYHIQLPGSYTSFEEAKSAADMVPGGFPTWTGGTYYARTGAYATKDEALSAQAALGLPDCSIVGTSPYGVSVTKTKTTDILFQFDGGASLPFGVKPGLNGSAKPVTWFKGYRYYGAFRYERLDGGNLTVVNIVTLEDYTKGVVPHEMSPSWPLEALKAQAVCARTYAMITLDKHRKYNFDLCNTTDCQVYRGLNLSNEATDRAVDETQGKHAMYNGEFAQTYYHSSDGGATETVNNVWNSDSNLPYLAGVADPHEAFVEDIIPQYRWTVSYTKGELADILRSKGYQCGEIVDFRVSNYSPTGNVLSITFVDAGGREWTFSKENVRTLLKLRSIRYDISGGGKYYINGAGTGISSVIGAYAIDGNGGIAQIGGASGPYAITSHGTQLLTTSGDSFTITGTGWGHNIGMSQWGANSMAKQGYTYIDILKFYFTGIDIY